MEMKAIKTYNTQNIIDKLNKLRGLGIWAEDPPCEIRYIDDCIRFAEKYGNITKSMMTKCNVLYGGYLGYQSAIKHLSDELCRTIDNDILEKMINGT